MEGEVLTRDQNQRILEFVMEAGVTLLQSGAEVARVQESMIYMARGLHLKEFDVYVITNGIMASAGTAELAKICHVEGISIQLAQLEAVNALSRDIAQGRVTDVGEAEQRLVQARRVPGSPGWAQVLAVCVGCSAFAMLFGGSLIEGLASFAVGAPLGWMLWWMGAHGKNMQVARILGAAWATVCCLLLAGCIPGFNADNAIIGCLLALTPGVAITMGIRDFVHADYLSGLIRVIDALVSAGSIACGVGAVYVLRSWFF